MNKKHMKEGFLILIFIALSLRFLSSTPVLEDAKGLLEKANNALLAKNFLEALKYSDKAFKAAEEDELKAEALYLYGKIADKVAEHLNVAYVKEINSRKYGRLSKEEYQNWKSDNLLPYQKIGLNIQISYMGYFYCTGDSYQKIVQNFPHTKWKCPASFKLLVIEKMDGAGWEGQPEGPEKEIEELEMLLKNCIQPEIKSEILYRIARDYMYITSAHQNDQGQFFDLKKAEIYRQKAEETLKKIIKEYPDYEEAKKAKYHLEELKVVRKKRHR